MSLVSAGDVESAEDIHRRKMFPTSEDGEGSIVSG